MVSIDISINTDNQELIKNASAEAIALALEAIGMQAQNYAVLKIEEPKAHANGDVRPNVDTGRLVNSIDHKLIDDNTVGVGTNVEYAAYVEMGTLKSKPYPYLEPAVTQHSEEYKAIVEQYLRNA